MAAPAQTHYAAPAQTHYAAGILPVTWHQGQALFLVGRDARDHTWSDFGGKCERADKDDPLSTAVREFMEESFNLVLDGAGLRRRLNAANTLLLRSRTQNGHPYYMYVAEVPYKPELRHALRAATLPFLKYRNMHKACVEKTDLMWVSWEGLRSPDLPKRSVFQATLDLHAPTLARLARLATDAHETWESMCASAQ